MFKTSPTFPLLCLFLLFRHLHRCKSCWGPDPYLTCLRCNASPKSGGAQPCPEFAQPDGVCPRGYTCDMTHHCPTCKATFLEQNTDCRCNAKPLPEDSDVERGYPKSKPAEAAEGGGDTTSATNGDGVMVKFVKEERSESTTTNDPLPKDVCRMFNLGICKNRECAQQHKCAKCLKSDVNLTNCNCAGAREFRETLSSGVKKEEPKKPDLPLGGCIKVS